MENFTEHLQVIIWGALLIFGVAYAAIVTFRPFTKVALIEVIIGCGVTNLAISVLLWQDGMPVYTIFMYMWGPYIVTGFPMAAFQWVKIKEDYRQAQREAEKSEQLIRRLNSQIKGRNDL